MKLLRKILGFLPLVAIGFTLLLALITFFLGLGKVIVYHYTDCLSGSSCYSATSYKSVYFDDWYVDNDLWLGNMFSIFGFLVLCASAVFCVFNILNKTAKGPWLLISGIMTFAVQFFLMARPIILVNVPTSNGIGDAFEAFNWITFSFSTLIWFNCIILFILNKTLFKKVLVGEQPQQEEKAESQQNEDWVCPKCGATVKGNFCPECGTKKSE